MYRVTKESLESLADKIRAKAEMAEPLEFPKGFENAVDSIEKGFDTSNSNTSPGNVRQGYIFYNKDGEQVGTMPTYVGDFTIKPSTEPYIINGRVYLNRTLVIQGEPNLLPENIPEDMTFFGVQGTRKMSGGDNTFYNDFWDTLMPTESSLKNSDLSKAKIINRKVFRPNKNIVVKDRQLFYTMNDTRYGLVDVPALCEELGIIIDYSQNTNFTSMHRINTLFERLGIVDCSNATALNGCFQTMTNLHTIDKWIVAEGTVTDNGINMFPGCTALVNLTVEGVIDFNINLRDSKNLSGESGISVLLALKDFAGTGNEFAHSAIFSDETWAKIETSEQRPPSGNSWQEYATNKKWATT